MFGLEIRGSVPLFWSQPGYKYRPPPRLDRGKEATLPVFKRHLDDLVEHYGNPLILVNLINQVPFFLPFPFISRKAQRVVQSGTEHTIGEAFLDHFLDAGLEEGGVILASFDFHEHCKGLQFRNVGRLVEALEAQFQALRFTWAVPGAPPMCRQTGVARHDTIVPVISPRWRPCRSSASTAWTAWTGRMWRC